MYFKEPQTFHSVIYKDSDVNIDPPAIRSVTVGAKRKTATILKGAYQKHFKWECLVKQFLKKGNNMVWGLRLSCVILKAINNNKLHMFCPAEHQHFFFVIASHVLFWP